MSKVVTAFLLGLFGFFVMMFVGETAGMVAGLVATAARHVGAGCSSARRTPHHGSGGEAGSHPVPGPRNTTRHLRGHLPWRGCGIPNRKANGGAAIELVRPAPSSLWQKSLPDGRGSVTY